jgi:hypothetical protein
LRRRGVIVGSLDDFKYCLPLFGLPDH